MEIDDPTTQKQKLKLKLEVVDERDGDGKRPKLHDIQNLEVFEERDGHMQNLEVPDNDEIEYANGFRCKAGVCVDEYPVTDDEEVEPYVERNYEEDTTMEDIPSPPDRPFPFIFPGETIDIIDLLFTTKRNFLLKNDGGKVMADDLKDKTIVLYLVPLDADAPNEPWSSLDMIDAYNELFPMGDVEFVFVAVPIRYAPEAYFHGQKQRVEPPRHEQEAHYLRLFSKLPFPAIPFGDDEYDQRRLVRAFKLDLVAPGLDTCLPYWSIIDSTTKTVVASISDWNCPMLFHYYAGAELYPLTTEHIHTLTIQSTKPGDILNNLDQLLTSFNRDSLLRPSTGEKVYGLEISWINLYLNALNDAGQPISDAEKKKLLDMVEYHEPDILSYCRDHDITLDRIVGCIPQIVNPNPDAMTKMSTENASEGFLHSLSNYCALQSLQRRQKLGAFLLPRIATMIISEKNRREISKYLFQEGVCWAKKDYNLAKHPDIDVPNLQVIKLMQSFKSKEYVRETFAWMHYYWFLTNDGIEFLRTYLNLPSEIVPATLKKQAKPPGRPLGGPDRPRGPPRFEGDRPRFGDRDGYRGGPRGPAGDFGGEKGGAPADFQPAFRGSGSGGRPGFGRGGGAPSSGF